MKLTDYIHPMELKELNQKDDFKAFTVILFNYGLIGLTFALCALFPHWILYLIALPILGGRQLGLAILMHDCAHNAHFNSPRVNQFVGRWLCGAPIFADLDKYRTYHLKHHRTAGSDEDPDRSNYIRYPVTKASFFRKALRDLGGITGLKTLVILVKMNSGQIQYQLSYDQKILQDKPGFISAIKLLISNLYPSAIFWSVSFSLFYFLNRPSLFLLWPISWLTTYMLFSRIRNAAEHAATKNPNDLNPLLNTRTTKANWWERLFLAPNYVNYHLEHHLLESIPGYSLPKFHHLLNERGALKNSDIRSGYVEVLRHLTSD